MRDFRKLKVWERSHRLTLSVYRVSESFPKEEIYGLTSQMRRAAASVPANIAEGCGRNSPAELIRFMHIASGSATELEYHLLLAHDLGYMETTVHENLDDEVNEVKKMLRAFVARIADSR